MSYDTQIVYPKLGEILAQVGSIISMLMIIQYVIYHYNEHILDCDFIDKVLNFYFFDYADLKKSQSKIDKDTCQELKQQARKKLVYTNIIYELSRIQLFLLNHFGRTLLEQTHNLGLSAKGNHRPSCELYDKFIIITKMISLLYYYSENGQLIIKYTFRYKQKIYLIHRADFNLLQFNLIIAITVCRAKSKTLILGNNNNNIGDSGGVDRVYSDMKSSSLKSIRT